MATKRDFGFDSLLVLNGDRYFIDDKGDFEAIFKVTKVTESPEIPYGIKYSLLLLNAKGERIICFDNAHAVNKGSGPGKKRSKQYDHKHVGNRVVPYKFKDAFTLLKDFWDEVEKQV
jgi:hypothetical protein